MKVLPRYGHHSVVTTYEGATPNKVWKAILQSPARQVIKLPTLFPAPVEMFF